MSFMAKAVNAYVHVISQFFIFDMGYFEEKNFLINFGIRL